MKIDFILNDKKVSAEVGMKTRLLDLIRKDFNLKGTKEGCSRGECGSCSVIVQGRLVNSCIYPAIQVRGCRVTTIEGLSQGENLHPLQQAFIDTGAVQCGFCTPAMVLGAKVLLDKNPDPSRSEIKEALSGVLCRCTGYLKIIDAVKEAAGKLSK